MAVVVYQRDAEFAADRTAAEFVGKEKVESMLGLLASGRGGWDPIHASVGRRIKRLGSTAAAPWSP